MENPDLETPVNLLNHQRMLTRRHGSAQCDFLDHRFCPVIQQVVFNLTCMPYSSSLCRAVLPLEFAMSRTLAQMYR
jgi:hypothetical protein